MKKINVAFCIPDMIIGGVETVLISTLEELLKTGEFNISVFMRSPLQEPFYIEWFEKHPEIKLTSTAPLVPFFENLKKHTKFFPLENIRKITFSIYKRYKRLTLSYGNIDIFIDYKNCQFFKELQNIKKPKITWIHGSFEFFEEHRYINMIKKYDKLVVLTNDFMNDFIKKYPEHKNKVANIYNPIGLDDIKSKLEKAPRYEGKYFCCVSRLSPPKDIRTIIYAFNEFYQRDNAKDIKLLIVGDGPKRKELEDLKENLVARDNIVFIGTATNPYGYMRDSIAHILSSTHEGFGMVLTEAAITKTLNISSNHKSGASEILLDGQGGYLFEIGDVIGLSKIMSIACTNDIERQKKIDTMYDSLERFSAKKTTEKIYSLIKETLHDHR